ncbi:MAG TPA: DUF2059 domain-containing protein [Blastocatellia bacterium]
MSALKFGLFAILATLVIGTSSLAQQAQGGVPGPSIPDAKRMAAARHVLDVTGAAGMGEKIWPTMMQNLKQSFPSIPEEAWKSVDHDFRAFFSSDDLLNRIATIYAEAFDEEELNQLAAFYQTPAGKKFIEKTPEITLKSFQVGSQAGQEMMEKALKSLREKGYKVETDF